MTLSRLLPVQPDEGAGPRWGLAASVMAHGLIVLVVLGFAVRHLPPDGNPAPSYDLVFEGPSGRAPPKEALPPPQAADIPVPADALVGPPTPNPESTPDPASTTVPPQATDAGPPPMTPEAVAPEAVAPAPMAPPSEPLESPAEAPSVRLELPPQERADAAPRPIMPEPPPPLPPMESRPQPPRPVTRPAARAAPQSVFGTLSRPMDLNLGPGAPRPAARGLVASRSLDLTAPPERAGRANSDPYAQIRAASASADWNEGLKAYWVRHRFYPEQAAANGEQGAVTIQLTVNRSGRVEDVEVLSRSGSQWLDMAALSTWRGAQLPPFTNEMREDRITFPIPIQYYLIRR